MVESVYPVVAAAIAVPLWIAAIYLTFIRPASRRQE